MHFLFRFLDRAAVVSSNRGPWSLCTVIEVEETETLMHMLPLVLSTVFVNTCLSQLQTFTIQQSRAMDTHISNFKSIWSYHPNNPSGSNVFSRPCIWPTFVPLARRITGIPTGIRYLQRIGIGMVLLIVSMAVAGLVETKRKPLAIEHGMVDSTEA